MVASPEGALEWHKVDALPVDTMAPDLPIILPRILALPPGAPPLFLVYTYDEQDRLIIVCRKRALNALARATNLFTGIAPATAVRRAPCSPPQGSPSGSCVRR